MSAAPSSRPVPSVPVVYMRYVSLCVCVRVQVPYAVFVPDHLMTLFAIGRQSALVVRVGSRETTVLPVSLFQSPRLAHSASLCVCVCTAFIYGMLNCFHIWRVYLLPYSVCVPASIWCVHLLQYMVCACFHIWCEPDYFLSAGLSAWHLNSPARYIWAFLWWLPGRSRQSEQSICTGQLL